MKAAPLLMRGLTVVATAAMFLVGGGILTHGLPRLHHAIEHATEQVAESLGALGSALLPLVMDGLVGVLAGALVLLGVSAGRKLGATLKQAV